MSNRSVAVFIAVALLAAAGFIIAQESTREGSGERGGRSRWMGEWFEKLTKAYEQKDMEGIGQLVEEMKQRRQRSEGRRGDRGPRGEGRGGPQDGSQSFLESSAIARTPVEKKILSVLEDMKRTQRRGMMNVPTEDGRLLRLLAETTGAKNVVEIGTSNGYSAIWLCLALKSTGGRLKTFEIDADRAALARQNFKRAGVDDIVTLVEGDAHEKVKGLKGPIDILFLDADKEGYIDYLNKLLPDLRPGGLVIAHNINARQADPRYVKAITTNADLETLFLHKEGTGVSVTLKKR